MTSAILLIVLFAAFALVAALADTAFPTATDVSTPAEVPTPRGTIPLERLEAMVSHEASGGYSSDRVISPPMTIAVRQEHPGRPTYQEALTYTFLIVRGAFRRADPDDLSIPLRCAVGQRQLQLAGPGHDVGGGGVAVCCLSACRKRASSVAHSKSAALVTQPRAHRSHKDSA